MSASPTNSPPHTGSPASPEPARSSARPSLQLPGTDEPRRSSIQFLAHHNANLPTGKPRPTHSKRRLSSPPPPPVFQPRVSFDTLDQSPDDVDDNSFTLISKHKDYEYTKRSRTFLCGCDDNDYSDYALQWLIDELVDDGDEIVCLRVVEKIDSGAADKNAEHKRYRSEANALMKQFQAKNHENKAINLVLEFAVGKVHKVIDEMINLYEPAILVVGTRGRGLGGFQGLLPGSVSKYCLQSSPVPVIVVLPSSKRDKSRNKRAKDPSRQSYKELLEKSGPNAGSTESIAGDRTSLLTPESMAPRHPSEDSTLVASEIGGSNKPVESSPLVRVHTAGSFEVQPDSPGVVMKSPRFQSLDTPQISDESSSEDEEEDGAQPDQEKTKDAKEATTSLTVEPSEAAGTTAPTNGGKKTDES